MSKRSWAIFVVLSVFWACEVAAQAVEPRQFFPIMAWDGPPNDPAVFKRMRECGLTVAGFVPPAALDACQAAGLKGIVSDPRVGGYDWTKVDPADARKKITELIGEV